MHLLRWLFIALVCAWHSIGLASVLLCAVTDGNVITANGLAPFAFAAEIFRKVAPVRESDISMYEALYSRGLLDE